MDEERHVEEVWRDMKSNSWEQEEEKFHQGQE